MKTTTILSILAASGATVVSGAAISERAAQAPSHALIESLVPPFGVRPNASPDGTGNCKGANAKNATILIPCFCPPDRTKYIDLVIQAITAGTFFGDAMPFNTDPAITTKDVVATRARTALIIMQSFNGTKGVGCPATSAPNMLVQQGSGVPSTDTFVA